MHDIILHSFPESLFAEKIRLILGYKKLAWKSVETTIIPPRPDLEPLTGGYRRTPVLQIGADIYCDTVSMIQALERIAPEPSVYIPGKEGIIDTLAQWGDTALFWACIGYLYQTDGVLVALSKKSPEEVAAYKRDRGALMSSRPMISFAETKATLTIFLQRLQSMLEGDKQFFFGAAPTVADFACYHPLWCLRPLPPTAGILETAPLVLKWMDSMRGLTHGKHSKLSTTEALAIGVASEPAEVASAPSDIPGIALGDEVEVMPSDYGLEPVRGVLVQVGQNHIAVRHHNEIAGNMVDHFPRIGYLIRISEGAA
jgi:glutathione S-transferase